jgi:hypothetical protein
MELIEWLSVLEFNQKIVILGLNTRYKMELDNDYVKKGINVDDFLNDDKFAFLYNKKINYVFAENDIIKIGLIH